jgi:quercetin dioxygenase-like cupin family protein
MHFRTIVVCFGAIALFAQSPSPIENDQARVVVVTDKPHSKSSLHEHKLNRVMIYLQPGRQEITPQNGKKITSQWKAGEVKWSPAGGMHQSEIVSDAPVTMVEVEVKKPGDPAKTPNGPLDPVKVASANYHVEFENSQVRVVRVHMGPHQSVPVHEHLLNRVVVYITDQNTRITSTDGKVESAVHKAGEASWGGPAKHKEENLGDQPFEAVVVEFKS